MSTRHHTRRRPRPWIVPPAAARPSPYFVSGTEILTELHGPIGVLLWLLHRDLELCATVAPERRGNLFRLTGLRAFERVSLPERLADQVRTLCDVLAGIRPDRAASCAAAISAWARPHAPRTALLFAETAARARPGCPAYARDVGVLALACGQREHGAGWLRRAIAIARRAQDWTTYAAAYADLGDAALQEDEPDQATDFYRRALLVYRRRSLDRGMRARGATGLVRAALRKNSTEEVDHWTRLAASTYRSYSRRSGGVLVQVARALAAEGEYARVQRFLEEWSADWASPAERLALGGLAVRAAAALRDFDRLDGAWSDFVAAAGNVENPSAEISDTVAAVLAAIPPDDASGRLQDVLADAARIAGGART
jgi:tetratricopeptide (TPR) repeat protein